MNGFFCFLPFYTQFLSLVSNIAIPFPDFSYGKEVISQRMENRISRKKIHRVIKPNGNGKRKEERENVRKKNGYTYNSIMKILDFNFREKASKVSSNVSRVCSQEYDTESSPYIDQDLKTQTKES